MFRQQIYDGFLKTGIVVMFYFCGKNYSVSPKR